eukprot:SM000411S15672  [mRNA]  locus=s411:37538:38092:- [translate_table: standard]
MKEPLLRHRRPKLVGLRRSGQRLTSWSVQPLLWGRRPPSVATGNSGFVQFFDVCTYLPKVGLLACPTRGRALCAEP